MEVVFLALEGRFSTTGPARKSTTQFFESLLLQHENMLSKQQALRTGTETVVAARLSAKHGGPYTTNLWFHEFLLFLPITPFAWKFLIPPFHLVEILVICDPLLIYLFPLRTSLTFDAHSDLTFTESTLLRINKVGIKLSWTVQMLLIQIAYELQKNTKLTLYSY